MLLICLRAGPLQSLIPVDADVRVLLVCTYVPRAGPLEMYSNELAILFTPDLGILNALLRCQSIYLASKLLTELKLSSDGMDSTNCTSIR